MNKTTTIQLDMKIINGKWLIESLYQRPLQNAKYKYKNKDVYELTTTNIYLKNYTHAHTILKICGVCVTNQHIHPVEL